MKNKEISDKIFIYHFLSFKAIMDKTRIGKRILNRVLDTQRHPEFISGSPEEQAEQQGKKNKESLTKILNQVQQDCYPYKKVFLSETGRSMVEILGVLAVVRGILL